MSDLIVRLGTLTEVAGFRPKSFSHYYLSPYHRRTLKNSEVVDIGDEDFNTPDREYDFMRERFLAAFPTYQPSDETTHGVLIGRGSVAAHRDGAGHDFWALFALTWMRKPEEGVLQVNGESLPLGVGDVIAFQAGQLHSWVCHYAWTGLFLDWDG